MLIKDFIMIKIIKKVNFILYIVFLLVIIMNTSANAQNSEEDNLLETIGQQISDFDADKLYQSGLKALKNENYKLAIELFKEVINKDNTYINAYNNLGIAYRKYGDITMAIKTYKQALGVDPDSYQIFFNLANAQLFQGDYDDSLKSFEHFKTIQPDNPEAYYGIATILSVKEEYEKANKQFLKAIDLYNDDQSTEKSHAYFNIATNYFKESNYNEAIEYFQKAKLLDPTNKEIYHFIALSYIHNKNYNNSTAQKYIKKAQNLGYKLPIESKNE